jgi:hypothetical protein
LLSFAQFLSTPHKKFLWKFVFQFSVFSFQFRSLGLYIVKLHHFHVCELGLCGERYSLTAADPGTPSSSLSSPSAAANTKQKQKQKTKNKNDDGLCVY